MKKLFILSLILIVNLYASLSEDKLKVIIIGKVAKYVVWPKENNTKEFHITILQNPFGTLPDTIYKNKQINNKPVVIQYIDTVDTLDNLAKTDILYIPKSEASHLQKILQTLHGKGIFTMSDIKGFAQKHGMLQLYFVSRKIKLKINLDAVKKEHLNIRSTLLRIAKVIKEEK